MRDWYFGWLLVCALIVAVGVALEEAELWFPVSRTRFDSASGMRFPRRSAMLCITIITRLGWILIIAGVVGEFVFEAAVSTAEGQVQTFNEIELAATQKEADTADLRSAIAYWRASENEKEAARLNKQAEVERMARVQLEDRVAWRRLTRGQQSALSGVLWVFAGEEVAIWYEGGDVEGSVFATDIANALRSARWRVFPPQSFTHMTAGGHLGAEAKPLSTGVSIQRTLDKKSRDAADALQRELSGLGFDAVIDDTKQTSSFSQVWVNIEPRPEGPQGEAKLRNKAKK